MFLAVDGFAISLEDGWSVVDRRGSWATDCVEVSMLAIIMTTNEIPACPTLIRETKYFVLSNARPLFKLCWGLGGNEKYLV